MPNSYKKYKSISKEEFIKELEAYSKWAEEYGENYVSESFFIYTVLGNKGYQFYDSKEVLNALLTDNEVEPYSRDMGDGGSIKCIRLKK